MSIPFGDYKWIFKNAFTDYLAVIFTQALFNAEFSWKKLILGKKKLVLEGKAAMWVNYRAYAIVWLWNWVLL